MYLNTLHLELNFHLTFLKIFIFICLEKINIDTWLLFIRPSRKGFYTWWPKLFWKNPYKNLYIFRTNPYNPYIFGKKIRTIRSKKSVQFVHMIKKTVQSVQFLKKSVQTVHLKKNLNHFEKNTHQNSIFLLQFFIIVLCVRV